MHFSAVVSLAQDGHMLRSFILHTCRFSSSLWKRVKWNGKVCINDVPVYNARTLVHTGDRISCEWTEGNSIIPADLPLDILYENESLLVVNKGPHMIIHPTSAERSDTLVNAVAGYFRKKGEQAGIHPVYRLDRNTTGIVVVAKSALMQYWLSLSHEVVQRTYLAVCAGHFEEPEGTIDAPIGRKDGSTVEWMVRPDGKAAVTHYRVLAEEEESSLLTLRLETGRTHQIRVHLSHEGHPLLGDDFYGGPMDRIDRQALHAFTVRFTHPLTKKEFFFKAPVPADMIRLFPDYDWKQL